MNSAQKFLIPIHALGWRTELFMLSFEGIITDRGEYVLIETPGNPTFYWGNLLLFRRPAGPGDDLRWQLLFRKEFASSPRVRHMTFGWDSPAGTLGEVEPFLELGFELENMIVLSTGEVHPPPKCNEEVVVRPLETDEDWEASLENQLLVSGDERLQPVFVEFKTRHHARMRRMTEAGRGQWYGAFLDGKLVADCGLFNDGEVGRYQEVGTHPDFRRRGICGTLVYEVARRGLEAGLKQLVMVADEHYHAARIYESIGFRPTERHVGMVLRADVG